MGGVKRKLLALMLIMMAVGLTAAPSVRWVPERASLVLTVPATTAEASSRVVKAWMPFITRSPMRSWIAATHEHPAAMAVFALTLSESKQMLKSAEAAVTLSMVSTPAETSSPRRSSGPRTIALQSSMKDPADGMYCFVENPYLNRAALEEAVRAWVESSEGELRLEKKDAWTRIYLYPTGPKRATEIFLAYREMEGGVVWVMGRHQAACDVAEGLIAGTAPTLAENSPLQQAFAPEVLSARTGGSALVITDWNALFLLEGAHPLLTFLRALRSSGMHATFDADGKLTVKVCLDFADEGTAEQAEAIFRALQVMMDRVMANVREGGAALTPVTPYERWHREREGSLLRVEVVLDPQAVYQAYCAVFETQDDAQAPRQTDAEDAQEDARAPLSPSLL